MSQGARGERGEVQEIASLCQYWWRLLGGRFMVNDDAQYNLMGWVLPLAVLMVSSCSTPVVSLRGTEPPPAESETMLRDIARQLHGGNTIADVFVAAESSTRRAEPSVRRFQILVVCGVREISVVSDAFGRYVVETAEFREAGRANIAREARSHDEVQRQMDELGRGCEWLSVDVGSEWHFLAQLDQTGRLTAAPEPQSGPGGTPKRPPQR
jgi:hypothetical protein